MLPCRGLLKLSRWLDAVAVVAAVDEDANVDVGVAVNSGDMVLI